MYIYNYIYIIIYIYIYIYIYIHICDYLHQGASCSIASCDGLSAHFNRGAMVGSNAWWTAHDFETTRRVFLHVTCKLKARKGVNDTEFNRLQQFWFVTACQCPSAGTQQRQSTRASGYSRCGGQGLH